MTETEFIEQTDILLDQLPTLLAAAGRVLVTAESCTGGWIAETATSRAGSSAWFDRAWVTYSNQAKQDMLGVSARTLARFGAVSEQTVTEMLSGALSGVDAKAVAVAVSGIAGPGGGSAEKPVGTVYVGWQVSDGVPMVRRFLFAGDRRSVRMQTVLAAFEGVISQLQATA